MPFRRYKSGTAFLDLLFNCLLGIAALFFLAFVLVNPFQKQADIKTKAEFVITVTWPTGNIDDVDTWLEDPAGNVCFFRQKEIGLMHLDRDDLGTANDTILLPDGDIIMYPHNQELMTIRGVVAGEWTLNIHMYKKRDQNDTPVDVTVDKLNPKLQRIFAKTIILSKQWQEETVTRFTLAGDGTVLSLDSLPKELAKWESASGAAGGGH